MAVTHTGGKVDYTLAAKTYLLLREAWVVKLALSLEELAYLTGQGTTRHHFFQLEAGDENGVFLGRIIADVEEKGLVLVLATRQLSVGSERVLRVGGQFFLYPTECGGLSSGSDGHYELELAEEDVAWTRTGSFDVNVDLKVTLARRLNKLAGILENKGGHLWL